ncbi:hypothetical protein J1614_003460 [Plenodomus biglobosus]|nr:hypothetical protein J1614_003460 [Plenodomus biglobosus]
MAKFSALQCSAVQYSATAVHAGGVARGMDTAIWRHVYAYFLSPRGRGWFKGKLMLNSMKTWDSRWLDLVDIGVHGSTLRLPMPMALEKGLWRTVLMRNLGNAKGINRKDELKDTGTPVLCKVSISPSDCPKSPIPLGYGRIVGCKKYR